MILEKMITRQQILKHYKSNLTECGYTYKDLIWINSQLELLDELIREESFNVVNELLRKTNYRLLKCIHKGHKNITKIIDNSYDWKLAKIEGNETEWLIDEAVIFETELCTLVFSRNQLQNEHKYINNKWQ